MKLLTKQLLAELPPIGATDQGNPMVKAKFFTPDSSWTWYVLEYDGEDLFYGLVDGFEKEFGYFSRSELESVTGPMGLHVERDLHWTPIPLSELKEKLGINT